RLGRDAACEICIDDPHVSRVHAEFDLVDGALVIRDLGSTNGVFVNGNRIREQKLSDGDKILVGTRLYFRFAYQDAQDQNYQQNLFKAANNDALTGLYNKKFFLDALPKEMSFARRSNEPLSLLILDIDFFKKINDTYGHQAGDTVLKMVGAHLAKHVRLENVASRYGGEEFAVILRNCSTELAHTVAERLRTSLEKETVSLAQAKITVTMSIGVATLQDDNYKTIEEFIEAADSRLYQAKQNGRNRTVIG
ncbi:GGDEF domain-containing protein, partial [bacterium]|nr:GGDEF domain-containing protein [bacterium]